MTTHRLMVTIAVVALVLVTGALGGCGKNDQSTDPIDQPVPDPLETDARDDGSMPPPPPPAGDDMTGSGSGTSETPAAPVALEFTDVNFEFDRYSLTGEARQIMAQNARVLENRTDARVIIEGHCDERGTIEYNLALGEKRASAVKDYLVKYGVASSRMRTISYGEERPLDPTSTEEAWARNRRAHLREQ